MNPRNPPSYELNTISTSSTMMALLLDNPRTLISVKQRNPKRINQTMLAPQENVKNI